MRTKFAVTFDRLPNAAMGLPLMCVSEFVATDDGQLEHYTDGRLRATVPPEGWDSYAAEWPDCAAVVGELRGRPAPEKVLYFGPEAQAVAEQAQAAADQAAAELGAGNPIEPIKGP